MKRFALLLMALMTVLPQASHAKKKNDAPAELKVMSYNIRMGAA